MIYNPIAKLLINIKIHSFTFLLIKAQNNVSILSDVSTCLNDALDTMFSNLMIPENNNINFDIPIHGESLSTEALKLMMNKRKLASNAIINGEHQYEENGNAKRLCSMNGQYQHEQKA